MKLDPGVSERWTQASEKLAPDGRWACARATTQGTEYDGQYAHYQEALALACLEVHARPSSENMGIRMGDSADVTTGILRHV